MPLGFHPLWLVALLVIVLIIFGPGKLPELGGALGRGIREFRKTTSELTDEVRGAIEREETPPPVATKPVTAESDGKPAESSKAEPEKKS